MSYRLIQEKGIGLKDFRIKLIELLILTLSAIFILLVYTKNSQLIYPAIFIGVDIILVLIVLMCGANKNKEIIATVNGGELRDETEIIQLSYEFTIWEYLVLFLYLLAILCFCLSMIK